jgi:hypothetical protein
MNEVELRDEFPESFLKEAARMGIEERALRGRPKTHRDGQNKENRVEMERVVRYIKETVFPKVKR